MTMAAIDDDGEEEAEQSEAVPFADELSFLTVDYLSNLMIVEENTQRVGLDFSSGGGVQQVDITTSQQPTVLELFRFMIHQQDDPDLTAAFYERMVACILMHPLAIQIQHINLSKIECGDDFIIEFVNQMKQYPTLLPNVEIFNVSFNKLTSRGMMAVAELLDSSAPIIWPDLQELYVQGNNENRPYHVRVEQAFAKILGDTTNPQNKNKNKYLIKFDLDCRYSQYRETIHQRLFQNLDSTKRQLRRLLQQQQQQQQNTSSEEEEIFVEFFTDETTRIQEDSMDMEMGGVAVVASSGDDSYNDDIQEPLLLSLSIDNNNSQSSTTTAADAITPSATTRSTLLLLSSLSSCFLHMANRCFSCFCCSTSRNFLPLSWGIGRGHPNHAGKTT